MKSVTRISIVVVSAFLGIIVGQSVGRATDRSNPFNVQPMREGTFLGALTGAIAGGIIVLRMEHVQSAGKGSLPTFDGEASMRDRDLDG